MAQNQANPTSHRQKSHRFPHVKPTDHRQKFKKFPHANPKAIVGGDGAQYRITLLTDGLIRYEWADDGIFEERASTFAIRRDLPVPEYRVIDTGPALEIVTDRFRLNYDKKPFSPSGFTVQVRGNLTDWHSLWRYGNEIHDLGGTARTLDDADGPIPLEHGIMSRRGFAGIDDSKSMLFEEDGWIGTRKAGGNRVDGYLFAYGVDYRECLKAFYAVSGKPPLLPRWAFGNWWSRYYPYSADEYLGVMDRFRKEDIPLSVGVLDMDWHHVDIDPKNGSGWTGYSWNRELFPDPPQFLSKMHHQDLKVTLNVHPADGVASHEDIYEEMAEHLGHDTESKDPIAFDAADRKFMDAYFDILHRNLEKDGVDFWWLDWQQGSYSRIAGIDPLWILNHYHYLDNAIGGQRPLTFSRYAGPGSHRYPIGFSGDTIIGWKSLNFQPEFTATASNIGYSWWSHDIGGHMLGGKDDELAARWVQLGVYSPILRLHSSNNSFSSKEPWAYGKEYCNSMISSLRFRHRLIPYLYSMNYLSARDGIPLVQPLYWSYPDHHEAYRHKNQFLFGTELLVAPITTPRDPSTLRGQVRAWLPEGRHIDIFNGAVYDGDREVEFHRLLEDYPVLAREGSIIPLDADLAPTNGGSNPTALEVIIIVGADGSFEVIEDNGMGSDVESTDVSSTRISFKQAEGVVTIYPVANSAKSEGAKSRGWTFNLVGFSASKAPIVSVNGKAIKASKVEVTERGTTIHLDAVPGTPTITVGLGTEPQLSPTDILKRLYPILDEAQIEYALKTSIWDALSAKVPQSVRISRLLAMDIKPVLMRTLLEYLLADERSRP